MCGNFSLAGKLLQHLRPGQKRGSGVFQDVSYDDKTKTLVITQPKNLSPLDAGAVMGAINKETSALKRNYVGLQTVSIGDIKISIK